MPGGVIVRPSGNPVALKVTAPPSGSVALVVRVTLSFSPFVCGAIAVTTGGRFVSLTVQVNVVLPVAPARSVAVTVTACAPALVYDRVPLITPVGVIVRPSGNPVALKVTVVPSGSVALVVRL